MDNPLFGVRERRERERSKKNLMETFIDKLESSPRGLTSLCELTPGPQLDPGSKPKGCPRALI